MVVVVVLCRVVDELDIANVYLDTVRSPAYAAGGRNGIYLRWTRTRKDEVNNVKRKGKVDGQPELRCRMRAAHHCCARLGACVIPWSFWYGFSCADNCGLAAMTEMTVMATKCSATSNMISTRQTRRAPVTLFTHPV